VREEARPLDDALLSPEYFERALKAFTLFQIKLATRERGLQVPAGSNVGDYNGAAGACLSR
jgi:hypothetical protein